MPKPQKVSKKGRSSYRVQVRRPTRGVEVDEYFTTKRAAERFIANVERAIDEGRPISQNVQNREKFAAAAEHYLADPQGMTTVNGRALKPSAARDRRQRIQWLARECFGRAYLHRLEWAHLDARLIEKAQELNWSSATRYRYETQLSRFLDYCKSKGWVATNVMNDQPRLNETSARKRVFTDAEWQALLNAADKLGGMLPMFLRLAWETGCRKSEIQDLRWVDIEHIEHKTLGAAIDVLDSKNHDDRRVFVSRSCAAFLRAHEQKHGSPSSPLVFPSRTRLGRYTVDGPFRKARTAAGLDDPDEKYGETLTVHHIRHTWATKLGERGASLAQLMAAGGWRTAQMAMRYMKRKDAQAMEAAVMLAGDG